MCCYAPQRSKEMRERAHPPNTFRFCFMQQKTDITNSGMRPPRAAEHSAVNRSVVGSSPTGGAHKARKFNVYGFYLFLRHAPRGQNRPSAEKSRHLIVNRKMNRNCVAGWVPVCCPMVNFKFYCRAFFILS